MSPPPESTVHTGNSVGVGCRGLGTGCSFPCNAHGTVPWGSFSGPSARSRVSLDVSVFRPGTGPAPGTTGEWKFEVAVLVSSLFPFEVEDRGGVEVIVIFSRLRSCIVRACAEESTPWWCAPDRGSSEQPLLVTVVPRGKRVGPTGDNENGAGVRGFPFRVLVAVDGSAREERSGDEVLRRVVGCRLALHRGELLVIEVTVEEFAGGRRTSVVSASARLKRSAGTEVMRF